MASSIRLIGSTMAAFGAALRAFIRGAVAAAGLALVSIPAAAQGAPPPPQMKQIAPDLHFFFHYAGSNAAFLVTEEGVLVIDARTHPRLGQELIDRIRKVTDKPIKWLVNTHFHGDHHFGNSAFKAVGATIVAQKDTARLMQRLQPKEMARRVANLKKAGLDPSEVKLVMPDVTFDSEMMIRIGGREVRLMYLGPGQQEGDTFIVIPHARALFTPGAFGRRSMPNMAFTPSVDGWIKLLHTVAALEVDHVLPAHGDVATPADVKELAAMIADEYATVKEAIAKGMSLDEAIKTLTFPQYKNWRNYNRLTGEIRSLYELIRDRRRSYME
jgi:glyoxylase-like metal-dependent hydrolase (beta-lactamase superfamily II)